MTGLTSFIMPPMVGRPLLSCYPLKITQKRVLSRGRARETLQPSAIVQISRLTTQSHHGFIGMLVVDIQNTRSSIKVRPSNACTSVIKSAMVFPIKWGQKESVLHNLHRSCVPNCSLSLKSWELTIETLKSSLRIFHSISLSSKLWKV